MTLTTRIFPAYNAALDLCRTVLTPAGVDVLDGPQTTVPLGRDLLLFGVQDVNAAPPVVSAGSARQDWVDIGAYTRDETFDLHGVLMSWLGSTDPAALSRCRTKAAANLGLLEAALRLPVNIILGGALSPSGWCGFSVVEFAQIQNQDGCGVQVPFVITCTDRI